MVGLRGACCCCAKQEQATWAAGVFACDRAAHARGFLMSCCAASTQLTTYSRLAATADPFNSHPPNSSQLLHTAGGPFQTRKRRLVPPLLYVEILLWVLLLAFTSEREQHAVLHSAARDMSIAAAAAAPGPAAAAAAVPAALAAPCGLHAPCVHPAPQLRPACSLLHSHRVQPACAADVLDQQPLPMDRQVPGCLPRQERRRSAPRCCAEARKRWGCRCAGMPVLPLLTFVRCWHGCFATDSCLPGRALLPHRHCALPMPFSEQSCPLTGRPEGFAPHSLARGLHCAACPFAPTLCHCAAPCRGGLLECRLPAHCGSAG